MFKRLFVVALIGVLGAAGAYCQEQATQSSADVIRYADASFADHILSLGQRKAVMDRVTQAADARTDDYEVQWRAAQAIFVYADTLYYMYKLDNYRTALARNEIRSSADVISRSQALSGEQAKSQLELGVMARKYADRAVQLRPDGVEGRYYSVMAIATYSFGKSIVNALLEGLGPKFETNSEKVLALNKEYSNGICYATYGRYFYKLPWPKKNIKKSLEFLHTAQTYDPQNIVVLEFLGDACYDAGKKEEAVQSWKAVLASPQTSYHNEYLRALVEAKLKYAR